MTEKRYRVFTRTWWKYGPKNRYTGKRELIPHMGRKTIIARGRTYSQARDICEVWNKNHNPGPLSRKAEFEEE